MASEPTVEQLKEQLKKSETSRAKLRESLVRPGMLTSALATPTCCCVPQCQFPHTCAPTGNTPAAPCDLASC